MTAAEAHAVYEARLASAQEIIDRLRCALRPFADYAGGADAGAGVGGLPDALIITRGSPLARRQLTIRHCRDAAFALLTTGVRV